MRLAKVTVAGFKSFADTTEFSFDAPITGIVGPNGCGKSNVVDAIKWVLGERSAKSLRGDAMLDVIFAGSAARKPMGAASVTLTFDNPVINIETSKRRNVEIEEDTDADHWERGRPARTPAQQATDGETDTDTGRAAGTVTDGDGRPGAAADSLRRGARESEEPAEGPVRALEPVTAPDALPDAIPVALSDDLLDDASLFDRASIPHRLLPIDTEQVDVTRRLYRDGRSEYLINNRKCRLRDIRDLFLDTGIGVNAYSIIEQGRVDRMLTANPVERRAILEEAAGVARFRTRKVEAVRKLERTEVNLVRVREQLASTERRLKSVRRQADRARRFQELDGRYRQLRTSLALEQYHDLRQRQESLAAEVTALEQQRQALAATLAELEDGRQSAEIARHNVQNELRDVQQQRQELEAQQRHAQQRRELTERNMAEAHQHVDADREQADACGARRRELEQQLEQCASAIAAAAEKVADGERLVARLSDERARLQEANVDARERLEQTRDAATSAERQRTSAEGRLHSLAARAGELEQQDGRLAARLEQAERDLAELQRAEAEAQQRHAEAEQRCEALAAELEAHERDVAALGQRQAEVAERLSSLRHERAGLESRLHLLQEMHQAREGLGEAVKRVLDDPERYPGVHGLLADAIDVDRRHAPLVEAALGGNLELLLVEHAGAVRHLGPLLRRLAGRVGLIACEGAAARVPGADMPARTMTGAGTPILSLMRVRRPAQAAVRRLLVNTFVVADLPTALRLQRGPMSRCRFVTRQLEVVEADGRVFTAAGRNGAAGTGWLSRRLEISELRQRHETLERAIADEDERLAQLASDTEQTRRRRTAVEQELHRGRHAVVEAQYQLQRLVNDRARLERERGAAGAERGELAARLEHVAAERNGLEAQIDELSQRAQSLAAEAAEAEQHLAASAAAEETARERLTETRVEVGQLGEKLEAARREHRQSGLSLEEAARQQELCLGQLQRRLAQIEQYEATIDEAVAEAHRCAEAAQGLEGRRGELEIALHRANDAVHAAAERLEDERGEASEIERRYNAAEIDRREVEVKRESLEERTLADLELDLTIAYLPHRAEREDEAFEPLDRETTTAEIDELRASIKQLGPVNIEAIEEEMQLEERNVDLIRQVEDIDNAHRQLQALITELDERSRTRFSQTFEAIREHFAGPEGMFRRLFGGGSADIMLLPDENGAIDWLESGIEIRAKPPGKEPRVISQLSGGEKAMTAVALLMAIFQSRPSPFCILDEVDAALDDANVDRFATILHRFLERSHFIVITHNKRTMSTCDRLYGVTMQERGVSRRVAVRVEHVNEDGTLREDVVHTEEHAGATNGASVGKKKRAKGAEKAAPKVEQVEATEERDPPMVETKPSPLSVRLEGAWRE